MFAVSLLLGGAVSGGLRWEVSFTTSLGPFAVQSGPQGRLCPKDSMLSVHCLLLLVVYTLFLISL